MIAPILSQGATTVKAYYPGANAWRTLDGKFIAQGEWKQIDEDTTVAVAVSIFGYVFYMFLCKIYFDDFIICA